MDATTPTTGPIDLNAMAPVPASAPIAAVAGDTTAPAIAVVGDTPMPSVVPGPAPPAAEAKQPQPAAAPRPIVPQTAPRIEACYFGQSWHGTYHRLARVLESTARAQCAGWTVEISTIAPPNTQGHHAPSHVQNVAKLKQWAAVVAASADGDRLLLIDADTAILRPLDDVWATPFDLAYTTRPADAKFPLNGGVLFVRVNTQTRAFMRRWLEENLRMLRDSAYHQIWRNQFGGINQAAFGALLATAHGLQLHTLPCLEWNCEDLSWSAFDPRVTRILHVKGQLRAKVFNTSTVDPSPTIDRLAQVWRDLEAQVRP